MRRYVESYEMPWPQHLDASQAVHKAYQVDAFPTFIVIDGDGIVTLRMRGWSGNTEQRLDNKIRKNLKAGAERQQRFGQR